MTPKPDSARRGMLLLLLLAALVWFGSLEQRALIHPDEGRYAEIAREMAATGDWLTPRLNDLKYFEKPALQYWATAAAFSLFGEHHWSARLWTALTGFLGILVTAYAGARLFGREAGLYAGLVLASSLLWVLLGHVNTLDMGVSFFMTVALAGFLLAQDDRANPRQTRNWMLVAWAATGLAILSKGLIGLVLPGAVVALYILVERDWRLLLRLHLGKGLLLMLAVTAPWFVAVSRANPEFFDFFFIHEHFTRFLTKAHGRYEPWWAFIPVLALGSLPWLLPLLEAPVKTWRRDAHHRFQPRRLLWLWAGFIFLFFSASSSKLPSYILPIFPALALLIGLRATQMPIVRLAWLMAPNIALALAALWLAPEAARATDDLASRPMYAAYVPWLIAAALCWLGGSIAGLALIRWHRRGGAMAAFAVGGLLAGLLVLAGHDSLRAGKSSHDLVAALQPQLRPDAPFFSVQMYDQTLPFYLGRTLTLVGHEGEMEFGLRQEPRKGLADLDAFAAAWLAAPQAMAVFRPDLLAPLRARDLPLRVLHQDDYRVVIDKP